MRNPRKNNEEPMPMAKSHSRWKLATGSSFVAGVAAAIPASAGTVQITLPNQIVSNLGPVNTINFDFTGDGVIDGPNFNAGTVASGAYITNPGVVAYARGGADPGAQVGGASVIGQPKSINGLIPITFTDGRINAGVPTSALIEIRASNTNLSGAIQILRTIFNDASTAAPAGVIVGGINKEFDPTIYAQRLTLSGKIKKLARKQKKLTRSGNFLKLKKLTKKLKKLNRQLDSIA